MLDLMDIWGLSLLSFNLKKYIVLKYRKTPLKLAHLGRPAD
jgi:hypothetical protein